MAKTTFFAIAFVVVSIQAAAWGQGPGNPYQSPYGSPAGPWANGTGVVPVSYMVGGAPQGTMQPGSMQPGAAETGPMMQGDGMMADGTATAGPCFQGCERVPEWQAFGEYLYLHPRDANVPYGVLFSTATQPENPPVPIGVPTIELSAPAVASIDYHPGFRVGMSKALDDCNDVVATYTHFEGENTSGITSPGAPLEIRSLVSHPSVWGTSFGSTFGNETDDWTSASSDYQMIYNLADVDFRWTFSNQNDTRLSLFAGMRYVSLDQRFDVLGTSPGSVANAIPSDVLHVHSQINFEGGGLRIGFQGERKTPLGLLFYGRVAASAVGGTFRCNYGQTSGLVGAQVVTGDSVDRVMPMLDVELGTGMSFWNDRVRVTSGYMFSGWFNLVRTDEFIGAVQSNNFSGMSNTLTFDGFVGRVEVQF